jgi:hypothetical protein
LEEEEKHGGSGGVTDTIGYLRPIENVNDDDAIGANVNGVAA